MLGPFMLQLKEINGQQKAQREIHSKDALTSCLSLQTLLAYFSPSETTNLLVRCYYDVTEQRGALHVGNGIPSKAQRHRVASHAMRAVGTRCVPVPCHQR